MKTLIWIIILIFLATTFNCKSYSKEYLYILNDNCINKLVTLANTQFQGEEISVIRDSRGIILRFKLENPKEEYYKIGNKTYHNIIQIKDFLAKINNPAIIEVHTDKNSSPEGIKNWEFSTIIANNLENIALKSSKEKLSKRVKSVGYGEFLPSKNTSYNGGNYPNRVDIIILCNISGE